MKHKKPWFRPTKKTELCFESSALSCGMLGTTGPAGSRHFAYSYDTFTGHIGPGFLELESQTGNGNAGVGFGPTGATQSYAYSGLCSNWVSHCS